MARPISVTSDTRGVTPRPRSFRLKLVFAVAGVAGVAAPAGITEAAAPALTPGEVRDDVLVLRRDFLARDRAFSPAARAEAEARLAALERTTKSLSFAAFGVEVCRIAALADNGHTYCDSQNFAARLNTVPIELVRIADNWYVVGAKPKYRRLLGARLAAIDGRPVDVVRYVLRSLNGGVPDRRDVLSWPFLKSPEALHALGVVRAPRRAKYRFVGRDGLAMQRLLAAGEKPSQSGWLWLATPDATPWAYRDLAEPFRWRDAPELDAVVVQLRQNTDAGPRSISAFLEETEQNRRKLQRRNFVLDLRADPGGDLTLTRDFMIGLPARIGPGGRVFVLIGPGTFSAGIANAAYLKQAGQDQVVLIGEPPGDRLTFLAEGASVVSTLPRSGLRVQPSIARHDYRDGCKAYDDCYVGVAQPGRPNGSPAAVAAKVRPLPIAIPSLDPQLQAPWTIEAFLAGRDPALDAVEAALGRPQ